MKLGQQLLLSYFLILGVVGYFLLDMVFSEARPLVRQSAEEVLVDSANLLAEILSTESAGSKVVITSAMRTALQRLSYRQLDAEIWGMPKDSVDVRVYITDANGIVLLDTDNVAVGEDFSEWNDVYLTLRGGYGARTTRREINDPTTTVLYVAAPIKSGEQIVGAVTLAKPGQSIQPFVDQAGRRLLLYGIALVAFCLLLGGLFVFWFSRRLGRLQAYAEAVTRGQRVEPPDLKGADEVASLAHAVTAMKRMLEGKGYFEQAMQMFVHELKGPLAAIRGAGEILDEEHGDPKLAKLSNNVVRETERLQALVDRMLQLARLEMLEVVPEQSAVSIAAIVQDWQESRSVLLEYKAVELQVELANSFWHGNKELLELAVNNLLDNAVSHVAQSGVMRIADASTTSQRKLTIFNQGPPLPDFALSRVFERFYSLAREDGQKSSGLGLAMVQEVAALHGGTATLENTQGGVLASMSISTDLAISHTQNT